MDTEIETVNGMIQHWAEVSPEAEVFTFVNRHGRVGSFTAREIYVMAGRFAGRLRQYGFSVGDVIANGVPNSPERLVTDMGIMMAGCVMVNCQILERDGADFWNTARIAGCRGVVVPTRSDTPAHRLLSPLMQNPEQDCGYAKVSTSHVPSLDKLVLCNRHENAPDNDNTSLLASLKCSTSDIFNHNAQPEDLAVLFATSGSTGFCKLVPRTHREVMRAGRCFQGAKNVKYFSDRPFGWMGGFPFDYLAYCSPRILQDQFSNQHAVAVRDLWSVMAREKCNGAAMMPTQIMELIQEFKDHAPEFKLGFIVTGGQTMRPHLLCPSIGLFTHALVACYSSTEVAMACVGQMTSDTADFYCGKPNTGVKVKVVDGEDREVGPGQGGHILIKSPQVFSGYYNNQPPCSDLFTQDGWFRTGDRGACDNDGQLYCYGRSGDVVTQGSTLVYSSWPESVLAKIPGVEDVMVVTMPDNVNGGNKFCACIIPSPGSGLTAETLMANYENAFITSTSGRHNFVPAIAEVRFVEDFPTTPTGKVHKRELLRRLSEG